MQDKLVLIDGNSIINRAFYGVPMLTNSEGLHTNAIYGFLNIMFRILEEEAPGYLAIAFDLKAPTFRHKMYEAYKGTRKPMPDELREQVPILKDLLTKMDICIVQKEGFEADDILGTLARTAEAEGFEVALVSGDRDLLQIATDHIKIRMPRTKGGKTEVEDFYARDVVEKYQLEPLQIIELKALMGDSSDNIPGVPKIGEKTATELLVQYHDIDNLKEHIGEITKKSVRETLENNFDMAVLSRKLATICVNADTGVTTADTELKDIYTPEAYELIKRLGFKQIMKRFEGRDSAVEERSITVSQAGQEVLEGIFDKAKETGRIGFAFVVREDKSEGLSLAVSVDETLFCGYDNTAREIITGKFSDFIINSDNVKFITYGLKSQLKIMSDIADISYSDRLADISIADYLINPLLKDYSFEGQPDHMAAEALAAYDDRMDRLDKMGMLNLYNEVEMPLVFCLYEMEKWGMLVKPEALKEYGK
nr:DNA polymerase I [Lachnospiraceae bacterium]